jgi:hypothetical protein
MKYYEKRRGSVAVLDSSANILECLICGNRWGANIRPQSGGKYYRGAWTCSDCGANTKTKRFDEALVETL